MEFFLSNRQYTLPYRIYGNGNRVLLAFHGFGRSGTDFQVFEKTLGSVFTMYAFDLPYHGKAIVEDKAAYPVFRKKDLHALIEKFCKEKNIKKFSLMGYSLGGKIALGCLEIFPARVENIFLLAPDGLKINPFYFLGTRTLLGRNLFRRIIHHPEMLFKTGELLERKKLIHTKINYFVNYHMDTPVKRERVFRVWMLFRKFIPDLKKITDAINENEIQIIFFFGRYDSVIPAKLADKIIPYLNKKNVVHVINSGHRLLEKAGEISGEIVRGMK